MIGLTPTWPRRGGERFRKLDEKHLFTSHAWELFQVDFESPSGDLFSRDIVRHVGAVGVLPVHGDNSVSLIRQWRPAIEKEVWEIPAGVRDVAGEDPAETGRRELIEEAGLHAESFELMAVFHNAIGFSDEMVWVFMATGLTAVDSKPQGAEEQHMAVHRFSFAEAMNMLDRGELVDVKTRVAISELGRRLG